MILLLDAGNTRIKWAVWDKRSWLAEGAISTADAPALSDLMRSYPRLTEVLGVNVAGDETAVKIAQALSWLPLPKWITSGRAAWGIENSYTEPAQLGADRWAAMIGARAHHRGPCLVVTAGTATTVDLLDASGRFLGGLILPGVRLMRQALAQNTAQLTLQQGQFALQPRSTPDAIESGCVQAQLGAVERMFAQIAGQTDAMCLLNGGDASRLMAGLGIPTRQIDNLVLKGLAVIADRFEMGSDMLQTAPQDSQPKGH